MTFASAAFTCSRILVIATSDFTRGMVTTPIRSSGARRSTNFAASRWNSKPSPGSMLSSSITIRTLRAGDGIG